MIQLSPYPVDKINERDIGMSGSFRTWRLPQCPFLVECSSAVLDEIRREVQNECNSPRGECETGGVLFGLHEPGGVRILARRPLPCEHAMGSGFVLSEKDQSELARIVSLPATDPQLSGMEALGWYHSHIRSRIFLSERDGQIHRRYFPAPHQIALVIHPSPEHPARAGFFFCEPSGKMRTESSYEEFTIEAPAPEREYHPPVPPREEGSGRPIPRAPRPQPQRQAICPRCGSQHVQRSRRMGALERLRGLFGFYPYRCHECLSRSFVKTSSDLLERARSHTRKRPEERRRARLRARRELLLWGGGILGFLAILYYVIRDTGPKPDQP